MQPDRACYLLCAPFTSARLEEEDWVGIYWNRDPKSEPEDVAPTGSKAKPARQPSRPAPKGRGWGAGSDAGEGPENPADAGDRRSRKR